MEKGTTTLVLTYDNETCCSKIVTVDSETEEIRAVSTEEIMGYPEIKLSLIDPTLGPQAVEFLHNLFFNKYKGKIWLITRELNVKKWADKELLKQVDGVELYFGQPIEKRQLTLIKKIAKYVQENEALSSKEYVLKATPERRMELKSGLLGHELSFWRLSEL